MTLALDRLRVLDLTRLLPGPLATQMLADFGADVIKIEEPGHGDHMRSYAPTRHGESVVFMNVNRNKRSMAIDLKHAEGRRVFLDLLRTADVLVESFRPGVMDRLGLGYEELAAENPRLVYCAITGYGQDGPYAQEAGHDVNYLARAGVLGLLRDAEGRPVVPGLQVADVGGGSLNAVIGILLALLARSRTGDGQLVDVAIVDGLAPWLVYQWAFETADDPGIGRYLSGEFACYNTYETSDRGFLAIGALEPKFWRSLCVHLERPDWVSQQFAGGQTQSDLIAELRRILSSRTRDEWIAELAPLDCCVTPVLDIHELAGDEHWRFRELILRLTRSDRSATDLLGVPVRLSATPASIRRPPPRLGEHTESLILELGRSPQDLERLWRSGALGRETPGSPS